MKHVPGYKPMSEAELHAQMKLIFGATDETMEAKIAGLNHCVEDAMKAPGPRILVMGVSTMSSAQTAPSCPSIVPDRLSL